MTDAPPASHHEGETVSGLALVVRGFFAPLGLEAASVGPEPDNVEYGAALVQTTSQGAGRPGPLVRVRQGKITPTKVGLFVTHWRRTDDGTTGPYDHQDTADALLVTATEPADQTTGAHPAQGVFVLDRETLLARGILTRAGAAGKRGFRVYPPWSRTAPGQATRTQRWQLERFVELPLSPSATSRASRLLTP